MLLDTLILIVLMRQILQGYRKGLLGYTKLWVVLVVSAYITYAYQHYIALWLVEVQGNLMDLEVLEGLGLLEYFPFVAQGVTLGTYAGLLDLGFLLVVIKFLMVMLLVMLVVSFIYSFLIKVINKLLVFKLVDKVLGVVIGFGKGLVQSLILVIVVLVMYLTGGYDLVSDSYIYLMMRSWF